ncbi:MAG: histidine kinase dimerization/phospho-acceptor domain-containing protein, partial [Candidatus Pacebacteria bacterium]|nr:histidine kinase dimerization/phospho-acceptor domain-containing protein [Candidatus Paceibacterota bacterium]
MYSYIVVFAEIIFMIMWYYSGHFWGHSIDRGVLDTLYYVLAYTWLSAYSIYAVRTHELAERGSFYAKHHQEMEIKEWRRLLGDIPEPIIFTYQGKVQYCNKATLRLLDLSSASIQTESAAMSTESPEEDQSDSLREKVLDRLDDLKQKGARRSLREIIDSSGRLRSGSDEGTLFAFRRVPGAKTLLSIKCVQTETGTRGEGMQEYILHDVTALKALEQNKAKEKCFDLLLATVSHDIRTPLNVMLGVIDLLEE